MSREYSVVSRMNERYGPTFLMRYFFPNAFVHRIEACLRPQTRTVVTCNLCMFEACLNPVHERIRKVGPLPVYLSFILLTTVPVALT
jgi:hypothetical protein